MSFILTPEDFKNKEVKISGTLISDLGLGFMGRAGNTDIIAKYLTADKDVICYRHQLFDDILKNNDFGEFLEALLEKTEVLNEICALGAEMHDSADNEKVFCSFRELLAFTECIDFILEGEKEFRTKIKSQGIHLLFDKAIDISKEEEYQNAKLYLEKTSEEIKYIKSVTVGINLDAKLNVAEAGIVSVNSQKFTTNTLLDKMFSKKIEDKNYICIEPVCSRELQNSGVSLQVVNAGLYNAMSRTVGKAIRKIKKDLYLYICQSTYFLLDIYDDLKFISMCMFYTLSMQSAGMMLSLPEISEKHEISELYNPNLVGGIKSVDIVKNNAVFDEEGRIFILTGANSGGKSVYLRAVGIAQLLFQLGLPVPAKKASMRICNEIFSHFASKVRDISGGRFENECKNILRFYKDITENSLVLLDEMFSTTGSSEGTVIAVRILKYMSKIGCKCVYTTHMHDLTAKIDEINSEEDIKSKVDGLAAEMINGCYTYKIKRCRESYSSYAEEICRKYGFDF